MTTVEIFRRDTGEVVERQEVNLRSFDFYWTNQANTDDYDYRIVEDEKEA